MWSRLNNWRKQHIAECSVCKKSLDRFHNIFLEPNKIDKEQAFYIRQITERLLEHFSYLDKTVDCRIVRKFLPQLADIQLPILIPTPITAHIDQCKQCKEDIAALEALKLEPKQLDILSKFYWKFRYIPELPLLDKNKSEAFHEHIETTTDLFAQMKFDQLSAETLKHICLRKRCREMVYQKRLEMSSKAIETNQTSSIPCESIKAVDLFTYCLPFGLDPANDQYAKFRPALTSHIANCPKCLEKIRQLHNTLHTIADRAESGVIIKYEFDPDAVERKEAHDRPHLYDGFPITVEVSKSVRPKRRAYQVFPRPIGILRFVKPSMILRYAAIIVVAVGIVALLSHSPEALARSYSGTVDVVKNIMNVCIRQYKPGQTEPIRVEWISKTLNIKLIRTRYQVGLRDLSNNVIMIKDLSRMVLSR